MLGAVYATQGATEPARAALRRALAIEPRDLATYENLAQLEMSEGNASAGGRFYAEALIVDPRSASARNGLARARAAAQTAVRRPWGNLAARHGCRGDAVLAVGGGRTGR